MKRASPARAHARALSRALSRAHVPTPTRALARARARSHAHARARSRSRARTQARAQRGVAARACAIGGPRQLQVRSQDSAAALAQTLSHELLQQNESASQMSSMHAFLSPSEQVLELSAGPVLQRSIS